jgi:hypothetical protein
MKAASWCAKLSAKDSGRIGPKLISDASNSSRAGCILVLTPDSDDLWWVEE